MHPAITRALNDLESDRVSATDAAAMVMDAMMSASVSGFITGTFVDPSGKKRFKPFAKPLKVVNGVPGNPTWQAESAKLFAHTVSHEVRTDGVKRLLRQRLRHPTSGRYISHADAGKLHHEIPKARGAHAASQPRHNGKFVQSHTRTVTDKRGSYEGHAYLRSGDYTRPEPKDHVYLMHKATKQLILVHKDDPRYARLRRSLGEAARIVGLSG